MVPCVAAAIMEAIFKARVTCSASLIPNHVYMRLTAMS